MPDKIAIRPMRKKDIKLVCRIIKALGAFFGDSAKGNERHLLTYCFGNKKLSSVLLASIGDQPAGFAITRDWINLTQGFMVRHVDFLFVEEKFRRAGVGVALMKAIKQSAVDDGCGLLDIGAGIKNKAANNLYKKLGFRERKKNSIQYRMHLGARK